MNASMFSILVTFTIGSVSLSAGATDILFSYDAVKSPAMYWQIRKRQFPMCVKTGRVIRPADGLEEAATYRCLKAVTAENDQTVVALFGPESAPIYGSGPDVFDSQSAAAFTNAANSLDAEAAKVDSLERNLFVDYVSRRPDAMACYQSGACRAAWDAWLQTESSRLRQWSSYYRRWGVQYRQSIAGIQNHLQSQRTGATVAVQPSGPPPAAGAATPRSDSQGILGVCMPNDLNCRP